MDNKKKKVVTGKIVSDKMDKSRVVAVVRKDKDPLYSKIINKTTKYLVHDETNSSKIGDIVEIVYVRPLSNRKSWEILKIVEKASI